MRGIRSLKREEINSQEDVQIAEDSTTTVIGASNLENASGVKRETTHRQSHSVFLRLTKQ